MGDNKTIGNEGEEKAAAHLISMGYKILVRNYRFSRFEIDIIGSKDETLHFIEVKSLSNDEVVNPEIHVTSKKFQGGRCGGACCTRE